MDNIQQSTPVVNVDRSDLSDFAGASPDVVPDVSDRMRIGQNKVVPDYMDYALRAYDFLQEGFGVSSLSYGPAGAPTKEYALTELMTNSVTFIEMFKFFDGVAYDSVQFRITCSAPKGLAGGFFVGTYPYQPWGDTTPAAYFAAHDLNNMTRQHLLLSPNSYLCCYGDAKDVIINVPWQHNVDYLTRHYVMSPRDTEYQYFPGTPILWFVNADARFLSTQTYPATIRVFVKFENLRFVAPSVIQQMSRIVIDDIDDYSEDPDLLICDNTQLALEELIWNEWVDNNFQIYADGEEVRNDILPFEHQSGLEVPVVAAATIGSEVLDSLTSALKSMVYDSAEPSSFEKPSAVQLAYVGDSTSTGPPPTKPIFKGFSAPGARHSVSSFITQSQLMRVYGTNEPPLVLYANPTAPYGTGNIEGNNQWCSYFRFFAQAASYWRGTLYFDFVVMGHPMVEVAYYLKIQYPPWSQNTTDTYSQNSILQGLCSGVYTISVPMPFMTQKDHMEVVDSTELSDGDLRNFSSSLLTIDFNVVSTALDASPIIPVAMFIRAGDDFEFLQPLPVGFSNILEHQCFIPKADKVFETRALTTPSTNAMVPFADVESFMSIWSRALPYGSYDTNDEPIVTLDFSTSPYWFPMNDSAAARTLGVQNSWYVTNDYISLYSSMFLFFQGSIAMKILCLPGSGYKYVSLSVGETYRQTAHNPFTADPAQLPSKANFGYGTVATDLGGQPVLELTVPLRSVFEWAPTNPLSYGNVVGGYYRTPQMVGSLHHNVVLHVPEADLQDALYRKIGSDFSLAVRGLLPPPTLWMVRGNNWS